MFGFIDDDFIKVGCIINGLDIIGYDEVVEVVDCMGVMDILLVVLLFGCVWWNVIIVKLCEFFVYVCIFFGLVDLVLGKVIVCDF